MEANGYYASEECVVCLDSKASAVFGPCRHQCACSNCSVLILRQKMDCPLCQTHIDEVLQLHDKDHSVRALPKELREFTEQRDEYIKRLNRTCESNAGFIGKGKLARSVGNVIGNELEQRRMENAGTERVCAKPSTVSFEEQGEILQITYKVGRKLIKETAPLIRDWESVKADLEGEQIEDAVELATYYSEAYWLCKYHKKSVRS